MSPPVHPAGHPTAAREAAAACRAGYEAAAAGEPALHAASRQLLGGARLVRLPVGSRAEVHAALMRGLPYAALLQLVDTLTGLAEADIGGALGISARTLRRHRDAPARAMPPDLASRAWLLAETLARATQVFGGLLPAQQWLARPATGLDGLRPIALLRTLQGAEVVTDFLVRLEHGVYT